MSGCILGSQQCWRSGCEGPPKTWQVGFGEGTKVSCVRVAVAASASFFFFISGEEPGWAVATYSPWLLPVSFCQVFFYVELILIDRAIRSERWGPSIAAGAGAGITFLGHAAPAFISVLLIAVLTLGAMRTLWIGKDRPKMWHRFLLASVSALAFLVTSFPMTWYVVGKYGMHNLNRAPFLFTYYALTLRNASMFLAHNVSLINLFAIVGIALIARRYGGRPRSIMLWWAVICGVLLVYAYLVAALEQNYGIQLPGTVPTFHYYFYLKACMSVGVGIAFVHGIAWIVSRPKRGKGLRTLSERSSALLIMGTALMLVLLVYPSYAHRMDLADTRERSVRIMENKDGTEVGAWISANTEWNAVVLCDETLSMWPVMSTARKVVATANTMCNPYVDHFLRVKDRDRMMRALATADPDAIDLLGKYGVTHLLMPTDEEHGLPQLNVLFPHEVFRNAGFVIRAR